MPKIITNFVRQSYLLKPLEMTLGYIFDKHSCDTVAIEKQMTELGCTRIYSDEPYQERNRPARRELLGDLHPGDTMILHSLANMVRDSRELAVLFRYCRVQSVRLISIGDRLDTSNLTYPDLSTSAIIDLIATIPDRVAAIRSTARHYHVTRPLRNLPIAVCNDNMARDRRVIRLYLAGTSIRDIMMKTGLKSRSSVFRALRRNGIPSRRKH